MQKNEQAETKPMIIKKASSSLRIVACSSILYKVGYLTEAYSIKFGEPKIWQAGG